jgi:hypothetical protein
MDAAHAEHRRQPTVLLQHPVAKGRQLALVGHGKPVAITELTRCAERFLTRMRCQVDSSEKRWRSRSSTRSSMAARVSRRRPEGGFDVMLGNPPFMGGLKISERFGDRYRSALSVVSGSSGGLADLCAYMYRRAFSLLKSGGFLGMVATNTIGQGDTREQGLAVMPRQEGTLTFVHRYVKWPGTANVEVNLVGLRKGGWSGARVLDGREVDFISSRLDNEPEEEPRQGFHRLVRAGNRVCARAS